MANRPKREPSRDARRVLAAIERERAIAHAFNRYACALDEIGGFAALAEAARQQAIEHLGAAQKLGESLTIVERAVA